MLGTLRFAAVGLVLAIAAPASMAAGEKETLSELTQIGLATTTDAVVVTISGSKAPDFTSFTMNEPFRVVVDWAGSKLGNVTPEKSFERGLIRKIVTKQFDSEAEKISRVTIELARETSYHVEADGKRVKIHFVPVPDPIPEPEPEPVKEEPKQEPAKVAKATVPEGPLTEPDVAVPSELPPMPQKPAPVVVAVKEQPKTAPQTQKPAETKVEPAKTIGVPTLVQKETKPAEQPVVAQNKEPPKKIEPPSLPVANTAQEKKPEVVAQKTEPAKIEPAKTEPQKPAVVAEKKVELPTPLVQKTEDRKAPPVLATRTEPASRTEPKNEKLASFPGVVPEKMVKQEPQKEVLAPTLKNTPASNPQRQAAATTTRFASEMPQKSSRATANVWQPPSVPIKQAATPPKRDLPVVKLASAQGEPLKPTSTLPADPDEPGSGEGKAKSGDSTPPINGAKETPVASSSSGGEEFDPGPRVMKYIGFQQMAEVSRVFVRCDGKAKFKEVKDGASTFVLELYNTSINVKNNERPLDTTYFNTAVQKVQAIKAGSNTRIEVKLKESVPYKISRIGNTIAIDFSRS